MKFAVVSASASGAPTLNAMVENVLVANPAQKDELEAALSRLLLDAEPLGLSVGDLYNGAAWTRNVGGEQVALPILSDTQEMAAVLAILHHDETMSAGWITEETRQEIMAYRMAMDAAAAALDDETASRAAILYPAMPRDGGMIQAGTRIRWRDENGQEELRKANATLWARADQDPAHAPHLWGRVIRQASAIPREIGEGTDRA